MLAFDVTKLQRLGKVYDLETEIKVLQEGENSGPDRSDWTDIGIDRYTKQSTNETEKTPISERESSSPADSPTCVQSVPSDPNILMLSSRL